MKCESSEGAQIAVPASRAISRGVTVPRRHERLATGSMASLVWGAGV